jgi:hypothetical protein
LTSPGVPVEGLKLLRGHEILGAFMKLRDTNPKTAGFEERAELVAKLGIKIYPGEDLTHIRIFCGLNATEPQRVSCHKISIASPKL